jgi:hypothetical protein
VERLESLILPKPTESMATLLIRDIVKQDPSLTMDGVHIMLIEGNNEYNCEEGMNIFKRVYKRMYPEKYRDCFPDHNVQ